MNTGRKKTFKCNLFQRWFLDKRSYSLIKKQLVVVKLSKEHSGRNTNPSLVQFIYDALYYYLKYKCNFCVVLFIAVLEQLVLRSINETW
jgi:hypothetical protein